MSARTDIDMFKEAALTSTSDKWIESSAGMWLKLLYEEVGKRKDARLDLWSHRGY